MKFLQLLTKVKPKDYHTQTVIIKHAYHDSYSSSFLNAKILQNHRIQVASLSPSDPESIVLGQFTHNPVRGHVGYLVDHVDIDGLQKKQFIQLPEILVKVDNKHLRVINSTSSIEFNKRNKLFIIEHFFKYGVPIISSNLNTEEPDNSYITDENSCKDGGAKGINKKDSFNLTED